LNLGQLVNPSSGMPQCFGGERSDSITMNKHLGEDWPSGIPERYCVRWTCRAPDTPGGHELQSTLYL